MANKAHTTNKFVKVEETKNYIIQVIRDLKKKPKAYRRKVIYDKDGYRHILNLAIICEKKGRKNCKTVATSIWHPKDEPKARKLKEKAKRQGKYVKKGSEDGLLKAFIIAVSRL